jgi:hypothetical protein
MSEFIAKNPSLWQEDIHDLFLEKW